MGPVPGATTLLGPDRDDDPRVPASPAQGPRGVDRVRSNLEQDAAFAGDNRFGAGRPAWN